MRRQLRRATAGLLAAGLLVACGGEPEDAELLQAPEADEEAEPADQLGTDTAPDSSSRGGEFLDVEAELTQQHPGGTVVEISGVRFQGGSILVDGEIRNEGDHDVTLRISTEPDRLRLVDDRGGMYDYILPDDGAEEETVEIPAGGTLEGPLTFIGPVDEEATSLRLVANLEDPDAFDPDAPDPDDERPAFVLEAIELETIE